MYPHGNSSGNCSLHLQEEGVLLFVKVQAINKIQPGWKNFEKAQASDFPLPSKESVDLCTFKLAFPENCT